MTEDENLAYAILESEQKAKKHIHEPVCYIDPTHLKENLAKAIHPVRLSFSLFPTSDWYCRICNSPMKVKWTVTGADRPQKG